MRKVSTKVDSRAHRCSRSTSLVNWCRRGTNSSYGRRPDVTDVFSTTCLAAGSSSLRSFAGVLRPISHLMESTIVARLFTSIQKYVILQRLRRRRHNLAPWHNCMLILELVLMHRTPLDRSRACGTSMEHNLSRWNDCTLLLMLVLNSQRNLNSKQICGASMAADINRCEQEMHLTFQH